MAMIGTAVDAFKCTNDPLVIFAIARLFWAERKIKKCSSMALNLFFSLNGV